MARRNRHLAIHSVMSRPAQLNIRSDVAVARTRELVRRSGMSATRIVEEALLAYVPPDLGPPPEGLRRVGPLLIGGGSVRITTADVEASLEETRSGVRD